MEGTYRVKVKLTAIIYLHPIVNDRLEGSALDNLSMFRKLCGPDCFSNIVLATSFWSRVDQEVGARREAELKDTEEFWGGMIRRGSEVIRLPNSRTEMVLLLVRLAQKKKIDLQIQHELVEHGLSITETEAGASSKDVQALQGLHEEYMQRLERMSRERREELKRQQLELEELRKLHDKAFEEQLRKDKEELERAQREHEETLRMAEEQRQKLLDERAELTRKTQAKTARLQDQLRRLAIEAEEKRILQMKSERIERLQLKDKIKTQRMNTQTDLITRATTLGRVKAKTEVNQYLLLRLCNACGHCVSAQLSYRTSQSSYQVVLNANTTRLPPM
jgi:hypothetical protein